MTTPPPPCQNLDKCAVLTWTKPGEKILPITGNPAYMITIYT